MTSSSLIGLLFVRRYPDMPCAADVVNTLDQQALASILAAYGEERHARKIASAIVEARRVSPITRTQQLASVVAGSYTPYWLIPCSILEPVKENKTWVEFIKLSPNGMYFSQKRCRLWSSVIILSPAYDLGAFLPHFSLRDKEATGRGGSGSNSVANLF